MFCFYYIFHNQTVLNLEYLVVRACTLKRKKNMGNSSLLLTLFYVPYEVTILLKCTQYVTCGKMCYNRKICILYFNSSKK